MCFMTGGKQTYFTYIENEELPPAEQIKIQIKYFESDLGLQMQPHKICTIMI